MTVEEIKKLAHEVIENYWNKKKFELADQYYTQDYINHFPSIPDVTNLDQFRQWSITFKKSFPDFKVAVEEIIVEGNMVATRWTLRCTQTGEYMGIPAEGKKVEISGMTMERIKNGKIAEAWWNPDDLMMLRQLGVVPEMEQVLE
jgi:steroid delta-isomerase-like uncharacterized protein